jgi:hypothetical protein
MFQTIANLLPEVQYMLLGFAGFVMLASKIETVLFPRQW